MRSLLRPVVHVLDVGTHCDVTHLTWREGLRVREQPDAPSTYAADPARRVGDLTGLAAGVIADRVAHTALPALSALPALPTPPDALAAQGRP